LRRETNRQVLKSRKVVIVGRTGALASEWVRREVDIAVANRKTPVIININGAVQAARSDSGLAAMAVENHWLRLEETLPDVESPPSDHAVAELMRSFRATRQETKRQRIVATAATIFGLAAAVAIWQAVEANWQRQIAVDNELDAKNQRNAATRNEALARENEQRATSERDKALVTQSRFLADVARRKTAEGNRQTAMLLALEALPDRNASEDIRRERPYVPEPAVALDASWRAPGQNILTIRHADDARAGRFSADGSQLLITSEDVRLWDAKTGRLLLDAHDVGANLSRAAFAPGDEQLILSGEGRLVGWHVKSRQVLYSIEGIDDYVLAPNNLLVTRSPSNAVAVRDSKTGRQLCTLGQSFEQLPLLTSGGDGIVTWQENAIQFWDARTCRSQGRPISPPERIVEKIDVTADGTRVAAALANNTIALWDVPNRRLLWTVAGKINSEAGQKLFSPDGKKLVAYNGESVSIIDVTSGRQLLSIVRTSGEDSDDVAFSPNGQDILYVPDISPSVPELWTLSKRQHGSFVAVLDGHEKFVRTAEFSPDGTSIVTASDDGTARLWQAATGKLRAVLSHDGGALAFAIFTPDSTRAVTASAEKDEFRPAVVVRAWDITEGQRQSIPAGADIKVEATPRDPGADEIAGRFTSDRRTALAVSRDHKKVVVLSEDDGLLLWDVQGGSVVAALEGHRGKIDSARFSADGLRILSVSGEQAKKVADGETYYLDQWQNEARVWDAELGRPLAVLSSHGTKRWTAQFAEGGILTSSESDGKHLWKYFANFHEFIEHVKATAPRCLDANERKAYFLDPEQPSWCRTR
jgi:WD40 repeat protein